MNIKYIVILLSIFVAFAGESCWGAAKKERKRRRSEDESSENNGVPQAKRPRFTGSLIESAETPVQSVIDKPMADVQPMELVQTIQEAEVRGAPAQAAQLAMRMPPSALQELPNELIEYIAKFLPPSDWVTLVLANRRLNNVIRNMPLYKRIQPRLATNNGDLQKTFFDAVQTNAIDVVNYLAPFVNINAQDRRGNTALIEAATHNNVPLVQMLLNKGADVNATDDNSHTAIMNAAENGHGAVVDQLIRARANLDIHDLRFNTALTLARNNGHAQIAMQLLESGAQDRSAEEMDQGFNF